MCDLRLVLWKRSYSLSRFNCRRSEKLVKLKTRHNPWWCNVCTWTWDAQPEAFRSGQRSNMQRFCLHWFIFICSGRLCVFEVVEMFVTSDPCDALRGHHFPRAGLTLRVILSSVAWWIDEAPQVSCEHQSNDESDSGDKTKTLTSSVKKHTVFCSLMNISNTAVRCPSCVDEDVKTFVACWETKEEVV